MIRALSFILVVLVSWPALAAEPKVALDVDVSALPNTEITEELRDWLVEHQTAVLRDEGIETSQDAPRLLRVVLSRYGEGDVHYRVTLVLVDRSTEAVELEHTITCELCRDTDLTARVGQEVARLLSDHLRHDSVPPPDPEPLGPAPTKERAPVRPAAPAEAPRARALGPLGSVGVASLVVGVSTTGAGIALALRPDRWRQNTGGVQQRSTRPVGLALVGVGSAVLVSGVALVTVDVVRRKRRPRTSLIPMLTPSTLTLNMNTRF